MTKQEFLDHLHGGDFGGLFRDCLWDNPTTRAPYSFQIGDAEYQVREAAQKKGFRVYVCKVETMPDSATRRLIDSRLRKVSHDYLAIFVAASEPMHHLWSVPVKAVDKRQLVTVEYATDDQAAFLVEKMNAISFTLDDDPTIIDVAAKVNSAFLVNTADVTKQFYQQFRKQHDLFVKGIENVSGEEDREWYASVMLNRLMFCYFIQKKKFLDFNEDYLGDKLKWVQAERGRDKFYGTFYKSFLKELFSGGLDGPPASRPASFTRKYGRIPYLNGGMFSMHRIEKENKGIDIPDAVFERLFAFFDQWRWHLDARITASGRDINPDVLGYIFEQYINDRAQMGAYYTKEDITEYIGRNTIVPWLLEKAGVQVALASGSESNPADHYIFPAMRKGIDLPLPPEIEKGVAVEPQGSLRARRAEWNKPAEQAYALPTEIWRETVARRQRCSEIRNKFARGEIKSANDFITYNLDIRAFAEDVIRDTADHRLVLHFYKALREITILDPTCGSGAFLFAALNILEPLYEACLDRMEEFHAKNPKLFEKELAEMGQLATRNRQYFICKSIILRNLYGVDIMHEAVEIARLRLFLKMVAVVDVNPDDENLGLDPLPDIDFNIRCGNTLVGYASEDEIKNDLSSDLFAYNTVMTEVNEEMTKAAMAFDFFHREQLNLQGDRRQLAKAKDDINKRSGKIRDLLDDYLFETNGGGKTKERWRKDTQPFHWFTEFYPIMHGRGGFDVIIGNPPYVASNSIGYRCDFLSKGDRKMPDIYSWCMLRSFGIIGENGKFGMIVPLSITFSKDFQPLRRKLQRQMCWVSSFDNIPAALFEAVSQRCSIVLAQKKKESLFSTRLYRWRSKFRDYLMSILAYTNLEAIEKDRLGFPKIPSSALVKIVERFSSSIYTASKQSTQKVWFSSTARNYISASLTPPPCLDVSTLADGVSAQVSPFPFDSIEEQYASYSAFCGNLAFMLWLMVGDGFHVTKGNLSLVAGAVQKIDKNASHLLGKLGRQLDLRHFEGLVFKKNAGKYVGSFNSMNLKEITRRGDILLLSALGFSKKTIFEVFDWYVRILATNDNLGEKGIPSGVHAAFPPNTYSVTKQKELFDEIDEFLAKHYGFTEEELDFIINYDIKYRMGDELNAGGE